ncbi:hypothetical protein Cgig2_030851 [Carnegiea gigantea]|uniref:Uncharacterized protein n=1 Tax=Carnegiea gigantea TaxID=171969 RepID=A0A9Q1QHT0_9CARY|nr:hypothetical protein Cgig2_030851 [Carnegiea gigantea]
MAKVHPGLPSSASSAACSSCSEGRESYTVWMKSLVFNGNGFTVYDSHGNLVYRIDNYDSRCRSQVFLMDLKGNVLCTLLRKKLSILEHWSGYEGEEVKNHKPWFQVKKIRNVFSQGSQFSCKVTMGGERSHEASCIRIQGSIEKSEFQIINGSGFIAAEVKRKKVSKGIMLGNDVLRLEVEPQIDQSLIMALVVVQGLISHKI